MDMHEKQCEEVVWKATLTADKTITNLGTE